MILLYDKNPKLLLLILQLRCASFRPSTHYETLGVSKTASNKEIKVAYYKKCKELHPDNNKNDPSSHNKFIAINRAYSVLSESAARRDYDQTLSGVRHPSQFRHGPADMHRRAAYTAYNPANAEHFYRNFYRERYAENESEFDKYIRNKYWQQQAQHQDSFTSPIRVMITIVVLLGLVDYFFVNYIYNQDVTSLRHSNRYSIYDKTAMASIHSEIAKGDEAKLDEQIRQFKEDEFRVRKPIYKKLQDSMDPDILSTSVKASTSEPTTTPSSTSN